MGHDLPPQVPDHHAQPPLHRVAHIGGKQHACGAADTTGKNLCVCSAGIKHCFVDWSHPRIAKPRMKCGAAATTQKHGRQSMLAAMEFTACVLHCRPHCRRCWKQACGHDRHAWASMDIPCFAGCHIAAAGRTGQLQCCMRTLKGGCLGQTQAVAVSMRSGLIMLDAG